MRQRGIASDLICSINICHQPRVHCWERADGLAAVSSPAPGKQGLLPKSSHMSFLSTWDCLGQLWPFLFQENLWVSHNRARAERSSVVSASPNPTKEWSSAESVSWTGNSLHLHSFPNRGHQWPDYNSTRQLDVNFIFPSTQGSYKKEQEGIAQWKNWIHTFFAAGFQPLY